MAELRPRECSGQIKGHRRPSHARCRISPARRTVGPRDDINNATSSAKHIPHTAVLLHAPGRYIRFGVGTVDVQAGGRRRMRLLVQTRTHTMTNNVRTQTDILLRNMYIHYRHRATCEINET